MANANALSDNTLSTTIVNHVVSTKSIMDISVSVLMDIQKIQVKFVHQMLFQHVDKINIGIN